MQRVVDNYLPMRPSRTKTEKSLEIATGEKLPVYSKFKDRQIWVAIIEKAYAKAHGCYKAISGGWISEGLYDLSGFPCETIWFDDLSFDSETTWCRLLSFVDQRFPMGASCYHSRDGLLGGHAYSLLDAKQLNGFSLGKQKKVTDYFTKTSSNNNNNNNDNKDHTSSSLRVVQLRNPHGKREWRGLLGAHSEGWTTRLRGYLGHVDRENGTFWMLWADFIARFSSVDICKTYKGWYTSPSYNYALNNNNNNNIDNINWCWLSETCFEIHLLEESRSWVYIIVSQPNNRRREIHSINKKKSKFLDLNFMLLHVLDNEVIDIPAIHLAGRTKTSHLEILLERRSKIVNNNSNNNISSSGGKKTARLYSHYVIVPFSIGNLKRYEIYRRKHINSEGGSAVPSTMHSGDFSSVTRQTIRVLSSVPLMTRKITKCPLDAKEFISCLHKGLLHSNSCRLNSKLNLSQQNIIPSSYNSNNNNHISNCILHVVEGNGTAIAFVTNHRFSLGHDTENNKDGSFDCKKILKVKLYLHTGAILNNNTTASTHNVNNNNNTNISAWFNYIPPNSSMIVGCLATSGFAPYENPSMEARCGIEMIESHVVSESSLLLSQMDNNTDNNTIMYNDMPEYKIFEYYTRNQSSLYSSRPLYDY